ncbi:MAG: NAD(P)H-dependent glycerol-3-phosphate dehydrogenase [Bacteroidota bacterium]
MNSQKEKQPVGVIGAGSFGTAIANLLSENQDVLLYSRRDHIVEAINTMHTHRGIKLSDNIKATKSLQEVAEKCTLIFPIVSSENFREMMVSFSKYLRPYHILIHGTKGIDTAEKNSSIKVGIRNRIHTMSEVILQESSVIRVGCLSGPNLSAEIIQGQPAATVIASKFDEIIKVGRKALRSPKFQVFGTHDILGAEMAGALKNVVAVAAGILGGLGLGYNIWGLLITRGLMEMIHLGKVMGADTSAFLGLAGIGDLVSTASSKTSRNYTFGMYLAQGLTVEEILEKMNEVAEGARTLNIVYEVAKYYKIHSPIMETLYKVVYEGAEIKESINYLMNYPYAIDVDFL